jgi:hypothetical protein
MADEKIVQCYNLAKAVERIDCGLQDIKTTVIPKKEMRSFNGVGMVLYSIQGEAKTIGKMIPEVKEVANKLSHRAKELYGIVQAISTQPVPKIVAEFIRDDLRALWEHQRVLATSADRSCAHEGLAKPEAPKEKFRPIPAEVKQAVAKVKKKHDAVIAKSQKEIKRSMKLITARFERRGKKIK